MTAYGCSFASSGETGMPSSARAATVETVVVVCV